jgi:hypothetical protein
VAINAQNLRPRGDVPVGPLREAIERRGLSMAEVARRLDWYERRPDTGRVSRMLGRSRVLVAGRSTYQQTVTWETAERLVEACDLDPHEVGV